MHFVTKTIFAMVSCFVLVTMMLTAVAAAQPSGIRGSIPYHGKSKDEKAMAALARITSEEAAAIARRARPGTVVETELEEEDGYLVWEVEVVAGDKELKLKIDAGDGRVLGIEREEKDEED